MGQRARRWVPLETSDAVGKRAQRVNRRTVRRHEQFVSATEVFERLRFVHQFLKEFEAPIRPPLKDGDGVLSAKTPRRYINVASVRTAGHGKRSGQTAHAFRPRA